MENQVRLTDDLLSSNEKKFQRIKILLYSDDFDFSQSLTMYLRKDYQKIITVNDRETLIQLASYLQPEIILLDINVSETLIKLIENLKSSCTKSKIFLLTSLAISQQDLVKRISKIVDKIFYQPIDLIEVNQILNFYTAD